MSWDQKLTQLFFFFFFSLNQDMCVLQVQGAGTVTSQFLLHSKFTLLAVKGLNVTPTSHPQR